MKNSLVFAVLGCLLAASACKKSDSPTDKPANSKDTIYLKVGELWEHPSLTFQVSFDSVLSDSRCPLDAICIWEGRVDARFLFRFGGQPTVFDTLANGAAVQNFPTDSTAKYGFNVRLLEMKPFALTTNSPIPQADYLAKLLVKQE